MSLVDTFDDVQPARDYDVGESAESSWSRGMWDEENDDNWDRWNQEYDWLLADQEYPVEYERHRHARESAARYRKQRLRKRADRIMALRAFGVPEHLVYAALVDYHEQWRGVHVGDPALDDEELVACARRASDYMQVWDRENLIRFKDYQLRKAHEQRHPLDDLLDAADLSPRDREVARAMRTAPFPTLRELAERFEMTYQRVQALEKRIRTRCREAALRMDGAAPEWTMERAPRRPGARGPARVSRVTVTYR
jgi:hypothetical protein